MPLHRRKTGIAVRFLIKLGTLCVLAAKMKKKFLPFFEKWASWKSVLGFFTLQMLFNLVIMPAFSGNEAQDLPVLDLQFFYTPQRAYEIIGMYSPQLRHTAAIARLTLDIIYPLTYGMMLALLLVITFRRAFTPNPFADWALFLPIGGVLFDYLENFGIATMFFSYPKEYAFLARITGFLTATKWSLIGISFLLALFGGVALLYQRTVKQKATS